MCRTFCIHSSVDGHLGCFHVLAMVFSRYMPSSGIAGYIIFNLFLFYLFIFGCIVHVLSLVAASRGYSSLQCRGFSLRWLLLWSTSSRCTSFSLRWLLLLWSTSSRRVGFSSCGTQALEHRLCSCGARA